MRKIICWLFWAPLILAAIKPVHPLFLPDDDFLPPIAGNISGLSSPLNSRAGIVSGLDSLFSAAPAKSALLNYRDERSQSSLSIFLGSDGQFSAGKKYVDPYYGIAWQGTIKDSLRLWARWWATSYYGDQNFAKATSPTLIGWYKDPATSDKDRIWDDKVQGCLSYSGSAGSVAIGRGAMQTGDYIGSSIILNNNVTDYGYAAYSLHWGQLQLSGFNASLIADSVEAAPKVRVNKNLALHKLDWSNRNWQVFLGEEIIYAHREWDPSYLVPSMFWRVAEHKLGDRDNVLAFGGINYKHNNHRVWFNLLLDELRLGEILGDWYGNKYALQSGWGWQNADSLQLAVQATLVRPWTYTHRDYSGYFTQDGRNLGFDLGPNTVQMAVQWQIPLTPKVRWQHFSSYNLHGSEGGTAFEDYLDSQSQNTYMLEGKLTRNWQNTAVLEWDITGRTSLRAGLMTSLGDDNYDRWFLSWRMFY